MFFPVDSDLSKPYLYGVDLTEEESVERGTLPYWMEERLGKDPGTWYHLPSGILTRNRRNDLCFPAAMGVHGERITLLQDRMMETMTMYSGGWQREVETNGSSVRLRVHQSSFQGWEQDLSVDVVAEWYAGEWRVKYAFHETTPNDPVAIQKSRAILGIISASRRRKRLEEELAAPPPILENERKLITKRLKEASRLHGVRLPRDLDKLKEVLAGLAWSKEDLALLWNQHVPLRFYNMSRWTVTTMQGKRPQTWTAPMHPTCSQRPPAPEELTAWRTACETIVEQTRALGAIVFKRREELAKRGQLWDPLFLFH